MSEKTNQQPFVIVRKAVNERNTSLLLVYNTVTAFAWVFVHISLKKSTDVAVISDVYKVSVLT
jgi:hypothetical protein